MDVRAARLRARPTLRACGRGRPCGAMCTRCGVNDAQRIVRESMRVSGAERLVSIGVLVKGMWSVLVQVLCLICVMRCVRVSVRYAR
jgi:hypothetical protein